jgi:diguanylate cyclase (GGDEF)-like protein
MEAGREPFLPYRDRVVYALAVATVVVVFPFAVNNFLQGRAAMGWLAAVFIAILLVDAAAIYRRRPMPIALWTLAPAALVTMVGAFLTGHYLALAWSYPLVILFYFILGRGLASAVAVAIILAITALSHEILGPAVATRLGATLLLTALLASLFVGIIADQHVKLLAQATIDPLTQAYNRRRMDEVLGEAVDLAGRDEAPSSLVLFDVDHFKEVNDRLGHASGDAVLVAIAQIVRARSRKVDRLFRSGGEEFVLYLPATDLVGATHVAEDVRRAIAAEGARDGTGITVSAGVSELQRDETAEAWLRRADAALYDAKRGGRDRVIARPAAAANEPIPG